MSAPYEAGFEAGPERVSIATPQHRANIIFLSYRLSQGGIGTQNRLLLCMEDNYLPELFADEQLDEVKRLAWDMIGPFFLNQKLHPATAIPWEDDSPEAAVKTDQLVTNELAGLFDRFDDRDQIRTFTGDLAGIAQSVIAMDADYLNRPSGRAGNSANLKIVVSPYARDPYDSIFVRYSILGVSTKSVEFDDMFSQLASEYVVKELDPIARKQMGSVLDMYLQTHPDLRGDQRILRVKSLCEEHQDG
ncbi:MAG: hypothetical protein AAB462_02510 [Patescibacteria group bacterium]